MAVRIRAHLQQRRQPRARAHHLLRQARPACAGGASHPVTTAPSPRGLSAAGFRMEEPGLRHPVMSGQDARLPSRLRQAGRGGVGAAPPSDLPARPRSTAAAAPAPLCRTCSHAMHNCEDDPNAEFMGSNCTKMQRCAESLLSRAEI